MAFDKRKPLTVLSAAREYVKSYAAMFSKGNKKKKTLYD